MSILLCVENASSYRFRYASNQAVHHRHRTLAAQVVRELFPGGGVEVNALDRLINLLHSSPPFSTPTLLGYLQESPVSEFAEVSRDDLELWSFHLNRELFRAHGS